MSYKLFVSIVPHDSGEFITQAANKAGATGGSILMGKGTAANSVLQLLGLGDTSKDIVYIVVANELAGAVYNSIVQAASEKKAHFGILFSIDVEDFLRAGQGEGDGHASQIAQAIKSKGDDDMEKSDSSYQMINVIVNKGYAEDAMAAARKAGAGGGTIISARGTAREDDAAFFGTKIVPEKDMLIILVPTEKKSAIVQAITDLSCFAEKGAGIIFCNEAKDFTMLGK